jgi:ATP/ADP translocase
MLRPIQRFLDLRPSELERGVLLFAYLFLVISGFVVAKAVRDALFLDQFGALLLPYADIAVAASVGLWVSVYLRIASRTSIRDLQVGSLVFFAVNCLVFWWLTKVTHAPWLTPVMYVWVGMFGVVAPAQVWTLANYVLTTREAKRLYGFIGSGATAGVIVGGYLTQVTVKRYGAESTLVGIAISLLLSAILVSRIWRRRPVADSESTLMARRAVRTGSIWTSLRLVANSPYLMAIAAVILLSSYTTAVAGWQFKAISSHSITGRNELAAFFGQFNFYAGIISLCLQWLLTGRLLRRFGLGFALFVVPVGLVLGSIGLLTFRSLAAVVALRGIDQILRYSIDRPSVELLYLPVPAQETNAVKSFIDTVVWRLGDGLAGATILIAASLGQMAAVQVTWVNLVLLAGWLVAAWVAQRLYVTNLQDSIYQNRVDMERASRIGLDRQATDLPVTGSWPARTRRGAYALRMLGAGQFPLHPSRCPRPAVARRSPRSGGRRFGCWTKVPTPGRRERWRRPLRSGPARAHPGPALRRASHAGGPARSHRADRRLRRLLDPCRDGHLPVAAGASTRTSTRPGCCSIACCRTTRWRRSSRRRACWSCCPTSSRIRSGPSSPRARPSRCASRSAPLATCASGGWWGASSSGWAIPRWSRTAPRRSRCFGDKVVGTLRDYLTDPEIALDIRREVPAVMLRVDTQAAIAALTECVQDPKRRSASG